MKNYLFIVWLLISGTHLMSTKLVYGNLVKENKENKSAKYDSFISGLTYLDANYEENEVAESENELSADEVFILSRNNHWSKIKYFPVFYAQKIYRKLLLSHLLIDIPPPFIG